VLDESRFHVTGTRTGSTYDVHTIVDKYSTVLGRSVPGDPSELTALANALRGHTNLQIFKWIDLYSHTEAAQITRLDPVLRALPVCPHLREVVIMTKYASADAVRNLLQLLSAANLHLVLEKENWSAVADEIRRGRCNVKSLELVLLSVGTSEATEAVKAVASAIRLDCNLEHLMLGVESGFTNEAGVALAEALTVNKTLCKITLFGNLFPVQSQDTLGVQSYEAFSAMLRVHTCLNLKLSPFKTADADFRLVKCRNQMRIEQRLNKRGRGRLLSSSIQTIKEEWVDALYKLSMYDCDDPSAFRLSCVFSLLRLDPSVVARRN
jgi:hypothetical protein